MLKRLAKRIDPAWFCPLLARLYTLYCRTLRYELVGVEHMTRLMAADRRFVACLWHDELFPLVHARRGLHGKLLTVVSASKDGEILARTMAALGIRASRGSSSRGGVRALLGAVKLMRREGLDCVVTVDGPRGPRHEAKEGALFMAWRTPAMILPIRIFMTSSWKAGSWDRFQAPRPFSRVRVVWGEPFAVTAAGDKLSPEETEAARHKLQAKLEEMGREEGGPWAGK